MKRSTFIKIIVAMLVTTTNLSQGGDWDFIIWPNAVDTRYEVRVGFQREYLEAYVAPSYDVSTDIFGVRVYGLYNAVDADMVANWLGAEQPLPAGALYAGVFGGWKDEGDQMEAGWLVGGRVAIKEDLDWTTEYQYSWTRFREDADRHAVGTGLRHLF